MHWMLQGKSHSSLTNKRLLYIMVLRPIWSYSIPLWGSAANSATYRSSRDWKTSYSARLQGIQLHQDLDIETVHQIAGRVTIKYAERLHAHTNTKAIMLLQDPVI